MAYKNSDVDLFIYGLDSEEAANKKLEEIYFSICEALPCPALCFRSKHAVSIVSQFPYRHIQIILVRRNNISEFPCESKLSIPLENSKRLQCNRFEFSNGMESLLSTKTFDNKPVVGIRERVRFP